MHVGFITIVALVLAVALFVLLIATLLFPERF